MPLCILERVVSPISTYNEDDKEGGTKEEDPVAVDDGPTENINFTTVTSPTAETNCGLIQIKQTPSVF